jgi:hypothetical protein
MIKISSIKRKKKKKLVLFIKKNLENYNFVIEAVKKLAKFIIISFLHENTILFLLYV